MEGKKAAMRSSWLMPWEMPTAHTHTHIYICRHTVREEGGGGEGTGCTKVAEQIKKVSVLRRAKFGARAEVIAEKGVVLRGEEEGLMGQVPGQQQ